MSRPEDVLEIEDIHVFEVMNDRFRHRIMRELLDPKPVKTLAERLDVPVTRLYYHVNQLADVGLIRVVEERKVGAIVEKVYQTAARSFRPGTKLLRSGRDPAEMARIAAAVVFDPARLDAEAMLRRHFEEGVKAEDIPAAFSRSHARMTAARAAELARRIADLLEEMDEEDETDDAVEYTLSVVFSPLADL